MKNFALLAKLRFVLQPRYLLMILVVFFAIPVPGLPYFP